MVHLHVVVLSIKLWNGINSSSQWRPIRRRHGPILLVWEHNQTGHSLENGLEIAEEGAKEGNRFRVGNVQCTNDCRFVLFRRLLECQQNVWEFLAQKGLLVLLLDWQPKWLQLLWPIDRDGQIFSLVKLRKREEAPSWWPSAVALTSDQLVFPRPN